MTPPVVRGSGAPVTVAAHGLGASVAETRPLLSGVPGTKVFPVAPGHGTSPLPEGAYDYAMLGRALEQVCDDVGATRALGVSMGAGALLSLLARRPDRFDRVVLFLPAALDRPRSDEAVRRATDLADVLTSGDPRAVERAVLDELPEDLRVLPAALAYARARSSHLLASPAVRVALRALPDVAPVVDRSLLGAVRAQVLVLAQEGDALHPADVAREVAAALPNARLVVFDRPGAAFRERQRLRALVSGWLAAGP